jgi:hypothetical protein
MFAVRAQILAMNFTPHPPPWLVIFHLLNLFITTPRSDDPCAHLCMFAFNFSALTLPSLSTPSASPSPNNFSCLWCLYDDPVQGEDPEFALAREL